MRSVNLSGQDQGDHSEHDIQSSSVNYPGYFIGYLWDIIMSVSIECHLHLHTENRPDDLPIQYSVLKYMIPVYLASASWKSTQLLCINTQRHLNISLVLNFSV